MQTSAMKVYFHIAECSLSYAKVLQFWRIAKDMLYFSHVQLRHIHEN